jgi:uncharacterized surface protein with fasciclin (FAS1) repeats
MKKYILVITAMVLLSSCLKKDDTVLPPATSLRSLATVLQNNFKFSMFSAALKMAGLDSLASGKGPYTFLLPDDAAFAASGITMDSLQHMDPALLRKILSYHILRGAITTDSVPQTIDYPFTSLDGATLYFSVPIPSANTSLQMQVNGVNVSGMNVPASNGEIQVMSAVLRYPAPSVKAYLESNPDYSYFVMGLKNFGLLDSLGTAGPFVLYAPKNTAYESYGYDSAAIAAMDTLHYSKWLFSAYIMKKPGFFMADFNDAPMAGPYDNAFNAPVYVQPGYLLVFEYGLLGISVLNYFDIMGPPLYQSPYIYGDQVVSDDPDHLTLNGVVHGVTYGLMADPAKLQLNP